VLIVEQPDLGALAREEWRPVRHALTLGACADQTDEAQQAAEQGPHDSPRMDVDPRAVAAEIAGPPRESADVRRNPTSA
jgi:hypothetical protein